MLTMFGTFVLPLAMGETTTVMDKIQELQAENNNAVTCNARYGYHYCEAEAQCLPSSQDCPTDIARIGCAVRTTQTYCESAATCEWSNGYCMQVEGLCELWHGYDSGYHWCEQVQQCVPPNTACQSAIVSSSSSSMGEWNNKNWNKDYSNEWGVDRAINWAMSWF
eukprot:g786.t1